MGWSAARQQAKVALQAEGVKFLPKVVIAAMSKTDSKVGAGSSHTRGRVGRVGLEGELGLGLSLTDHGENGI